MSDAAEHIPTLDSGVFDDYVESDDDEHVRQNGQQNGGQPNFAQDSELAARPKGVALARRAERNDPIANGDTSGDDDDVRGGETMTDDERHELPNSDADDDGPGDNQAGVGGEDYTMVDGADQAIGEIASGQQPTKPKKLRPKLELQTFTSKKGRLKAFAAAHDDPNEDPNVIQLSTMDDDGNDENDDVTDEIWTFFTEKLSKFPTLNDRLEREQASIRAAKLKSAKLLSRRRNPQQQTSVNDYHGEDGSLFVSSGIDDELTEAQRDKVLTRHLDELMRIFRHWSREIHPAGWSLLEFAKRMDVITQTSPMQAYRADLIRKYKLTDWQSATMSDPAAVEKQDLPPLAEGGFDEGIFADDQADDDEWMTEDVRSAAIVQGGTGSAVSNLSEEQKELIRKRREACVALKRKKESSELIDHQPSAKGVSSSDNESRAAMSTASSGGRVASLSDEQKAKIAAARQRAVELKRMKMMSTG